MKMKMKKIFMVGAIGILLASCTVSHTAVVTNNSVGSKVGKAKAKATDKKADFSFSAAMKNGNISKIGIAEMKVKVFFFPRYTMTVTGE